MIPTTRLLAVVAVTAVLVGCKESGSTGATSEKSSGTSTSTSATATTTTPATGATSMTLPGAAITGITEQMKGGMKMYDLVVGPGAEATRGKMVKVAYTGWLTDGSKFDSSAEGYSFQLGAGQVVKGWDEGIVGMKVGGKRKLVIPPDMGYGSQGYPGAIPPNATLVFDVELVDVH